jgi:hypothetical protein
MSKRPGARTMAERVGDGLFYAGFLTGVVSAGALLYYEMKDMQSSLFDQLAANSAVTLSLIAAFLTPLGIGWFLRFLISGRRWS